MIIASDSPRLAEADRVMEICNACRYCEGICATFQAMASRRSFTNPDLDYLANLCHNCTACFHDCQYAPPHDFNINVPAALTDLRIETYERYAWPLVLGQLFHRNGMVTSAVTTLSIIGLMALSMMLISHDTLFERHTGAGAFYAVIGHGLMVSVAGGTFGFSVVSIIISLVKFWRTTGSRTGFPATKHILTAVHDALTLRYLDGGHGEGCSTVDDGSSNQRRYFHQLTMWGFILCFASTCVATVYDYGFGIAAPYPIVSLPVLLGTSGGLGLLVGPAGLVWNKVRSDPRPMQRIYHGMDYAFLASLFLVSLTGLALLALRETSAMGVALVIHLGFVLGFFLMLPYSKFVHMVYRFAALVLFAQEKETWGQSKGPE